MAAILALGIATLDIICSLAAFPPEDAKLRALGRRMVRGGNAANTAVVLSQLGHQCRWAGALARDAEADLVLADFARYGINDGDCCWHEQGVTPTSYVWQSQATASRTIVHHRQLAEFSHENFLALDLHGLDWLHFEGRHCEETGKMLATARQHAPGLPLSLEVEKYRPGIEGLFCDPDVTIFSRDYAAYFSLASAPELLAMLALKYGERDRVCTWGEQGAWSRDKDGQLSHAAAVVPPRLVDTLGAGDTFNAGLIDALLAGNTLADACRSACALASRKCAYDGLGFLAEATHAGG